MGDQLDAVESVRDRGGPERSVDGGVGAGREAAAACGHGTKERHEGGPERSSLDGEEPATGWIRRHEPGQRTGHRLRHPPLEAVGMVKEIDGAASGRDDGVDEIEPHRVRQLEFIPRDFYHVTDNSCFLRPCTIITA